MDAAGHDACLLSTVESVGYFSGLFLEGLRLLVLPGRTLLYAAPLARSEAAWYAPAALAPRPAAELWSARGPLARRRRIAIEPQLPAVELLAAQAARPAAQFFSATIAAAVRAVKDEAEIEAIRRAGGLMRALQAQAAALFPPGVTEAGIARRTASFFAGHGAGEAFPTVAAAGHAAGFPHAVPRPVPVRSWLVWDFGARCGHYCADCTRVLFPEHLSAAGARRLEALREAVAAAVAAAGPGVPARAVDAAARAVLGKRGLARFFIHGLGHGVGLSVHERPVLSPASDDILRPGMVVTVEPGVYLPGWGGLRLEDTWLVTDQGLENLTATPTPGDELLQRGR